MNIRAKFRCTSFAQHVDQPGKLTFLPVMSKCGYYPGGSEENTAFWEATPAGKLEISSFLGDTNYKLGAFYYIDLVEVADDPLAWKLWQITRMKDSLKVTVSKAWSKDHPITTGTLELDIHNKTAWAAFEGKVDTKWLVSTVEASPSDAPTASC